MNLQKFEQNLFTASLFGILLMGIVSITPNKESNFIKTAHASEIKIEKNIPVVYILGKKLTTEEKLALN